MSQSHYRHHHSVHGGVEHETHAVVETEASAVSIPEIKVMEPKAEVAKTGTSLNIPSVSSLQPLACMSLVTSDLEREPKPIQQAASGAFTYIMTWNSLQIYSVQYWFGTAFCVAIWARVLVSAKILLLSPIF